MSTLESKVVLITGASRGLGRALALALARGGARLSLCARGAEHLEAVATEARALGAEVLAVSADVGVARDVERLASRTLERFDRIDVLVNNASELGPTPLPHVADCPPDALRKLLEVNVLGPLRLTQAVLGSMVLRGAGLVINVSSDAAVTGYPGWGPYGSSKAALDALTRSLAVELEGTGVHAISVDPGDMDTAMHRAAAPDDEPAGLERPEDVAESFLRLINGTLPAEPRVEAARLR